MMFKIFQSICLLFLCSKILAANVDLAISTDIDVSAGVEFRDFVAFSITLSNYGNDDAGTSIDAERPNDVYTSLINQGSNGFVDVSFRQNFNIAQDCFFVGIVLDPPPNGVVHYAYDIAFPVIPAHSSVTCYGYYHIGFEDGIRKIKLRVNLAQGDSDTNLTNNETEIVFGIRPQIIPTLSPLSLVALLLLVLMLAYLSFLKTRKTATFL